MKNIFIYTIIALSTLSGNAQDWRKVSILPQSKIQLHGVSNVNSFTCEVCGTDDVTTMNLFFSREGNKLLFEANEYRIPIKNFICENSRMTNDLQEALNMAAYPAMSLELKALTNLNEPNKIPQAKLRITLAGKSNTYDLTYTSTRLSENFYHVVLTCDFKMSEFNIEPPTALLGLIKVNDKIDIKMDLYILLGH